MITMELKRLRRIGPTAGAVLLGMTVLTQVACTTAGGMAAARPQADQAIEPQEPSADVETAADSGGEVVTESLTKETLYDILLAEIAGQRGRLDVSAPHYLQAALDSNDPRVAERAVQIAAYAKEYQGALRAARHWLELDPSSVEARKVVTALALKLGDMDEVVAQLDYLVAHSGNQVEGFQLATAVLARHADKAVALDAMEQLASRYPDSPQARLAVSRLALHADEPERALDAVDAALQLQPDLADAMILKAQILVRQDRQIQATATLAQAVEHQPDNASLRFAYGRMLLESGDIQGAKYQFGKVVELEPGNNDAVFSLALLELETGDIKPAERHLKILLERGDKLQAVYYYLGYAAEEGGDDDAAVDWYRQVEEGDYWTQSRLHLARIMVKQGRLEDVRREIQALRRNNPENAIDFYMIEGQILSDSKLDNEAFKLYTEALLNHPDNEKLLYARALVAEKIDSLDVALQDLQHILNTDPDNVRALNALGYTLADRTDRYAEALVYIEKAYAQEPDDPAIMDSLGWVHYRLGNLGKAQEYLQQAFKQSGDGEIGAHLGEVLWAKGDQDAARRIWNEALENDPDNPVLREVMQRYQP
jgi:tetratricopeptide (TPR) repeat protein